MIGVGLYCKKNATSVDGFVLGGLIIFPIVSLLTQKTVPQDIDKNLNV